MNHSMKQDEHYRNEYKYLISSSQVVELRNRLLNLLPFDANVQENGIYQIRSLYFDTIDNRCYYENENGVDPREKFRIRIYNGNFTRIKLECKRKEKGKTHKSFCDISYEQCMQLAEGRYLSNVESQPEVLRKLTLQMMMHQMQPKVIIEYDRIPFICANGNTRITFDMNLRSSQSVKTFFDKEFSHRLVMPRGMQILEVKYDEYLPEYIYESLHLKNLQQTTFSKYYLGRKYTI